jgi:hypothetical protein
MWGVIDIFTDSGVSIGDQISDILKSFGIVPVFSSGYMLAVSVIIMSQANFIQKHLHGAYSSDKVSALLHDVYAEIKMLERR